MMCSSCLQALATFKAFRVAAAVAAAAALLTLTAVLASGARLLSPAAPLLLAAAAAALYSFKRLNARVQGFHFVDYQHALR